MLLPALLVSLLSAAPHSPIKAAISPEEIMGPPDLKMPADPAVVACHDALVVVAQALDGPDFEARRSEALTRCSKLFQQPACAEAVRTATTTSKWPAGLGACCIAYPVLKDHADLKAGFCHHDKPLVDREAVMTAVGVLFHGWLMAEQHLGSYEARRLAMSLGILSIRPDVEIPEWVRNPDGLCTLGVGKKKPWVFVVAPDGHVTVFRLSSPATAKELDELAKELVTGFRCAARFEDETPAKMRKALVEGLRARGANVYASQSELPQARSVAVPAALPAAAGTRP